MAGLFASRHHLPFLGVAELPVGADWLSTVEAAAHLGVQQRTVWAFIERGDLPATRYGQRWRIRLADVHAYLEQHRVQPGDLAHLLEPRKAPEG